MRGKPVRLPSSRTRISVKIGEGLGLDSHTQRRSNPRNLMVDTSLPADAANLPRPAASARSRRAWAPVLALCLYALAILVVGAQHEAWFDEAQAWLIARDATPLEIITRYAHYEGSPPLWHLTSGAGSSRLSVPLSVADQRKLCSDRCGPGAIPRALPVPDALRDRGELLLRLSVPDRGAQLRAGSGVLPPAGHAVREAAGAASGLLRRAGAAGDANTHSFLISGVLGLEYALAALRAGRWKEPRILAGAALYGAFALAAAAMAWPPKDVSFATYSLGPITMLRAVVLMAEPFVERIDVWAPLEPSVMSRLWGAGWTTFLLIPSVLLFVRARTWAVFLGAFAVFFAFTAAKYGQAWHTGILFTVWVFALWVSWSALPQLSPLNRSALFMSLFVILGVQAWYTAAAWSREVSEVYSPGRAVAGAIADYQSRHPAARVMAFGEKTFAVQPWARANLFTNFNGGAKVPAFYDWRSSQPFTPHPSLSAWTAAVGKAKSDILLLSDFDHMDGASANQFYGVAAKSGLCARFFNGQMIWKTHDHEGQGIAMFTRCGV